MNKELVVVVLAAGTGKRFWPFSTNKIIFPFFGKPFIEYSIGKVHPKEVARIVIITNQVNDQDIKRLHFSVPHVTVVQSEPKGMADALLTAEAEITNSRLLVLIADDLFDTNVIASVFSKASSSQSFGILSGWKSPAYFPGGYLLLDDTKIKGIIEKPGAGNEPSPFVNISGHFIKDSNKLLDLLKQTKSSEDDVYERSLSSLMQKEEFLMVPYEGYFASLKFPWNILDVMDNLLATHLQSHRGRNIIVRDNVVIEGNVYIGDNVQIFENTKIIGPCFIGEGTIIGNNNIIRQSHIGAGCVTGFNTDITRSYIGDNCWFHSNYIGDSVLEGNISMGSGTVLANLRLDESEIRSFVGEIKVGTGRNKLGAVIGRDVRIGVNASIMPGVKIGSGSCIGAGVVLDRDLKDNSFCVRENNLLITTNSKRVTSGERNEFRQKLPQ